MAMAKRRKPASRAGGAVDRFDKIDNVADIQPIQEYLDTRISMFSETSTQMVQTTKKEIEVLLT